MKKILLSVATIATITTAASATSEVDTLKVQMAQMMKKIENLEASKNVAPVATIAPKSTLVKAKASKLEFSGTHFIHFTSNDDGTNTTNKFSTDRNYLQVKAYFFEDPKSYMRVTLDAKQNSNFDDDSLDVRVKYAYLFLNNVLPFTGVEIGLAHTPWLDFEEHHGWKYRAIGEAFSEQHYGGHLQTSSDYGVNFKTKTEYFSSELGIFNGAGYHGEEDGEGLRAAWRLTGHILGTGKSHHSKTYADVSFFGQYGQDEEDAGNADGDLVWYGVHAVYNQPEFLVAAQYVKADKADDSRQGDGWSVNGEFRLKTLSESLDKFNTIARYDDYTLDNGDERKTTIAGLSYKYNKNIEFITSYEKDENTGDPDIDKVMITAQVKW